MKKTIKILGKVKRKILEIIYKKRQRINLKKICKIAKMEVPKEYKKMAKKPLSEISLSVRDLKPNCIFFCVRYHLLKPENLEEIRKNATFVVTPKPIEGCNNIIIAKPSELGLQTLRYLRNLSKVKTIAVTGSVGKTSTKEMIETVLREKYKNNMIASVGNSNSSHKTAFNVKKLTFNDKILLQEAGAGSGAHDIVKETAVILDSNIVVYTNIKDSHIEWYGSRENIAKEKFTLSDYGKKDGLAIINYDDDILRKHNFVQQKVSFSLNNKKADYYAKNIKITSEGTTFTIINNIKKTELPISLKVIGEHHILNALVAYTVAESLEIKEKTIEKGLKKYRTSGARQNLIDLGKYKVLADCYNSSYDAIKNILKTFDIIETKNNGHKIAVIGDIFELGKISEETHKEVGKLLAKHKLDKVIFQGPKTKDAYEEYKKLKKNSIYCNTRDDLIKTIKETITENDIILFKASHGMQFAEAIDTIFGTDIGETSALGHKEYKTITDNNFTCNLFANHATINEYNGKEKIITLPNKVNDLPVEKLGRIIFRDNKKIEKIVLSENISRLRGHCFKNSSLKTIEFNKNLKAIGPGVFYSCSKLEDITLPDGLLTIEYKAFAFCKNLKSITIPNSVQKISNYAFLNTKNVTIICKKYSYAEKYAKKNGLKYTHTL